MGTQKHQTIDLSKIIAAYADQWVALSHDERRVVASGKTPAEALTLAHAKGEADPILMWAPKEHSAYIL